MLSIYQHGFRNHLSCTIQLLCVTHDIYESIDKRAPTHVLVLDFSKAFDVVPHHILFFLFSQKLIDNRINTQLLRWKFAFLKERT